jgi:hypothetical protein
LPTGTLPKERRSNEVRLALLTGLILRQKIGLASGHAQCWAATPRENAGFPFEIAVILQSNFLGDVFHV